MCSYDKVIEHLRNDQLKRRIDRLMTQINCPRPKQFQLYNADKSIYYLKFSTSIKLSDTKPLDVSRLCRIKICATPVFESFDDSNVFDMIVAAFMDPLGKRGIDETKAVNKEAANVIESLISSAESGVVPVPGLQAVHATLGKPYSVELGRSLLELKSEANFTKDIMDIIRAIQPTAVQIKQYLINSDGISPFHGKLDILIDHSIVVMVQRTQSEDSEDGSDSEDEVVDIVAEVKAPANGRSPTPQAIFGAFAHMANKYLIACEEEEHKQSVYALSIGLEVILYRLEMDLQAERTLTVKRLMQAGTPVDIMNLFHYSLNKVQ